MQQKPSRSGVQRPLFNQWQHCVIRAVQQFNLMIAPTSGKHTWGRWKLMPLWLGSILLFTGTQALALTTLTVKVTVLAAPSCVVNGGDPIEVKFSDEVITTRVNGYNYMQLIPTNVECKDLSNNNLRLKVQGTPAYFGRNVLATEQDELGIALLSDGRPLGINHYIQFTYPKFPVLHAVPVKSIGSALNTGKFSAAATLMLEYQ